MPNYSIISADAHILEPPDIWKNWLPERYQDKAPHLVKDSDGGDAWLFAAASEPDPIGLTATPGMPWDKFRWKGVTYDEARAGCYNGAARVDDMTEDGVDAEILFPPQRTIGHFLGDEDDDFVLAGIDAYNNFLADEFCAPDPSRLIGAAQIPSIGIDAAVDGVRKAKARGFKTVVISCWPAGGESISDDDDAFWAAAQDEGLPVCIHINMISRKARMRARQAAAKAGGRQLYGEGKGRAGAKAAAGLVGCVRDRAVHRRSAHLHRCVRSVPEPAHLHGRDGGRMAAALPRGHGRSLLAQPGLGRPRARTATGELLVLEHECARSCATTTAFATATRSASTNMMWSTDYPHHGNDWPYSRKVINETMAGITPDEKQRHRVR